MTLAAVDPDSARTDAQEILGGREFRSDPAPRPFRGPLEWVGDRLEPVLDFFGRVFGAVPWWLWLAFALTVLGLLIAMYARRAERRAARLGRTSTEGIADAEVEDPRELDRRAEAAERAGDFDLAVRLRFRAGLLRLGERGRIAYRPSVTTSEVRRVVGSADFDQIAETFEEIAYGGRGAAPPDIEEARVGWPRVHDSARSR